MNNLQSFLQTHRRIILILSLALFVRIIPACLFFGGYDSVIAKDWYYSVKADDINGLYSKHLGLSHFPGWIWLICLIGFGSELTGIPYHILFKFPAIFADLAITVLIYKAFLNLGMTAKRSSNSAMVYALNPVVILITALNGQFDSLTILFCLLTWYFYKFGRRFKMGSAVFLGMGFIIKEFPAILFPAFWGKLKQTKERIKYLGYFLLPIFIAIVIAYFTITLRFIPKVLAYPSTSGFWGISLISQYLSNNINSNFFAGLNLFVKQYMRYILLGIIALVWALCLNKKTAVLTSIILIFATFYFITPGLGVQYLVWIVPFAVIAKDPMLKFYTIFVSVVTALWFAPVIIMGDPTVHYHSIKWLNFTRNLFSVFGWAVTGIWMYRLLKIHLEKA